MSLDYKLGAIENWQSVCFDKHGTPEARMNPVTHAIIWATIAVDIGNLTAANALDFFERLDAVQRDVGGLLFDHGGGEPKPYWITLDEVVRHVGLRTNVPNMRRSAWNKKREDIRRRELAREGGSR